MLTARKPDDLCEAAESMPGDVAYLAGNVGDREHAVEAVETTLERFGSIDILVNNAATNPYYGRLIDADLGRFRKTVEVNLEGPIGLIQQAWTRHMKEHGGVVLNIASIGGYGYSGPVPIYDLTKAALIHVTRQFANELGPKVRVNALAPGLIRTEFARALWEPAENGQWPWPLQRLGMPDDLTGAALFLTGELSSWITGAVLVVDGGALVSPSLI
jgi:NAD(P)-dependent dehydrogenase (short-subunit alcohol dehydrogenase family)